MTETSTSYHFNNITLLVTHYNRSYSLQNLLGAFSKLNCSFGEIIVSDDASKPEHQQRVKELLNVYPFRLISAANNKGLGNNINKGQAEVKTPYTLYIQEDFEPTAKFVNSLTDAVLLMEEDKALDMTRFYAFFNYPLLQPYKFGFAKMIFSPLTFDYKKFQYYSDHPHLRRSDFLQKFGSYAEGINPEQAEYRMGISFLQKKGKSLFYTKYHDLFIHGNSATEPSTMQTERKNWKRSNNLLISLVREVYRHVKFRFDFYTTN